MPKLAEDLGTAAWHIEDPLSQQAMQGTVQTSGTSTDVDSYQSELQGIHAMLLGLLAFCQIHEITGGHVTLGCNNMGGVQHGQRDWCKVALSMAHVDLIWAIRVIKAKLPIQITFEHIFGHQDDQLSFNPLLRLAQMNVEMDKLAKDWLAHLYNHPSPNPWSSTIAHEGWQCSVNGVKLTSHPAKAIRRAVFGTKLCSFLVGKQCLTRSTFVDINWDAMEMATDIFPPLYRLWVSKHVSSFFGHGVMMRHWKFWDHSRCPCCNFIQEDKLHLLTCPHQDCFDTWQDSLLGLEAWMTEMDTDPAIMECILLSLETHDPTQSFAAFGNPRTLQAAQAQDQIRWLHTMEGKLSAKWQQVHAAHYRSIDSRRSPKKWAAGLITNLLMVTHSQWLHRCAVLHARDAQGLKLKEGQELQADIQEQFLLGLDGLQARDHHYITRDKACVFALPPDNKKAWLSSVKIARQTYLESKARELDNMRHLMQHCLAGN
jgi:hypothetical protein